MSLDRLKWYLLTPCLLFHQLIQLETPDPQSPHPSASLLKTEETLEKIKQDPNAPEPMADADIDSSD